MGPLQQMLPTGDRSFLERQASSIGILLLTVLALAVVFAVVQVWGVTSASLSGLGAFLLVGCLALCRVSEVDTTLFALFIVVPVAMFLAFVFELGTRFLGLAGLFVTVSIALSRWA